MSEENIAFVRGRYEAFNRGDVEAVLGAFDENIEWYEAEGMPHGGLYRGPQAVAENVFARLANDIENFSVTPEEFYADGDEVVVISMYTGKAAQTGNELAIPGVHAWTVRDGKITRLRQFTDTAMYNEALGVGATA